MYPLDVAGSIRQNGIEGRDGWWISLPPANLNALDDHRGWLRDI
jgi:hypothetical protein